MANVCAEMPDIIRGKIIGLCYCNALPDIIRGKIIGLCYCNALLS